MLKGKNINLRTIKREDLGKIFELTSDIEQIGEFWNVNLSSEVMFKKRYEETGLWNENFGTMVITDKDNRLIGDIAYFKGVWYLPGYEIGYRIYREDDRGKGYTTEALELFTRYLFDLKPVKRLEIQVSEGNIASRKVAEKCGFKYEGLKRQAVFSRGKYEDIELFAMIREDLW